jgi:2-phosphosulfolactate phosphatase
VVVDAAHRQLGYDVRFDWGLQGASAILDGAQVAVVVDVLSFTTAVSVASDGGVRVFPFRGGGRRAIDYAQARNARLAVPRAIAGPADVSLSPVSLRSVRAPARVVLPSPNGSTLGRELAGRTRACVAACLRNARAVADWIRAGHETPSPVAVIAAGERWTDGTLRPALEDLWGAGAVISHLASGGASVSPEASLARLGYEAIRGAGLDALLS